MTELTKSTLTHSNLDIKVSLDTESQIYKDALDIRRTVFIDEQQVPEDLEIDNYETQSIHLVGYLNHKPVTTARILKKDPHSIYKIQRVATLQDARHKGLARQLFKFIEHYAKDHHVNELVLDAQDTALMFYEKLGFTIEGVGFLDADMPHHTMRKYL